MSQDLFAAFADEPAAPSKSTVKVPQSTSSSLFDDFGVTSQPAQSLQRDLFSNTIATSNLASVPQDNQDDWGDFEEAETQAPPAFSNTQAPVNIAPINTPRSNVAPISSSTSSHLAGAQGPARQTPRIQDYAEYDPNVLFDADRDEPEPEDEEGDETFGDFEEAIPTPQNGTPNVVQVPAFGKGAPMAFPGVAQAPAVKKVAPVDNMGDLLGLDMSGLSMDVQPVVSAPAAPQSSSFDLMGDFGDVLTPKPNQQRMTTKSVQTPIQQSQTPLKSVERHTLNGRSNNKLSAQSTVSKGPSISVPVVPSVAAASSKPVEDDEPWDDFDAWDNPQSASVSSPAPIATATPALGLNLPSIFPNTTTAVGITSSSSSGADLPPSNIPPPAVILPLFPTIFDRTDKDVFRALAGKDQPTRDAVYRAPQTHAFVKGYIALSTVCARVIAGRKQRWRRDTLLSQSMRIGPASSGRASGMKVASVDRAESAREDREVEEVLRVWKLQLGRLKHFVAEMKKSAPSVLGEMGVVPDLAAVMPIKVLKETEGGFKSTRPCGLCGLNRDERVAKVEGEVHDSFGEWWVESASMHRSCRNFWHEHEQTLRQR